MYPQPFPKVRCRECEITVSGEQLTGTVKWQDILKLYEFDKCHVYRLLPKVTDRHVKLGV
jgi:hypothetical protein